MTARQGGIAEPEYRLPAMVFPAIIGPMGVLTFGQIIANKKSYWGAATGFGMCGFGLTAASNIVVTYAVDGYRPVGFTLFQRLVDMADADVLIDRRRSLGDCLCSPKHYGLHPFAVYRRLDQGGRGQEGVR